MTMVMVAVYIEQGVVENWFALYLFSHLQTIQMNLPSIIVPSFEFGSSLLFAFPIHLECQKQSPMDSVN